MDGGRPGSLPPWPGAAPVGAGAGPDRRTVRRGITQCSAERPQSGGSGADIRAPGDTLRKIVTVATSSRGRLTVRSDPETETTCTHPATPHVGGAGYSQDSQHVVYTNVRRVMALSNRDRIGKAMELLGPALNRISPRRSTRRCRDGTWL